MVRLNRLNVLNVLNSSLGTIAMVTTCCEIRKNEPKITYSFDARDARIFPTLLDLVLVKYTDNLDRIHNHGHHGGLDDFASIC